jgi:hypothetical protein
MTSTDGAASPTRRCEVRHPSRNVTCHLTDEDHLAQLARPGNSGGITHCGWDVDRLVQVFWTNRDRSVTDDEAT